MQGLGGYEQAAVESARLTLIQSFDPAGVATRDLVECLLPPAREQLGEDGDAGGNDRALPHGQAAERVGTRSWPRARVWTWKICRPRSRSSAASIRSRDRSTTSRAATTWFRTSTWSRSTTTTRSCSTRTGCRGCASARSIGGWPQRRATNANAEAKEYVRARSCVRPSG